MSNSPLHVFDRHNATRPWPRTTPLSFATALARRALPQRCMLCVAEAGGALLCSACGDALPRLRRVCPRCALPTRGGEPCAICAMAPPPFAATVAALAYAHPVDRLLQAFKYRGQLSLADWAGAELASAVRDARAARMAGSAVDGLLPIPLTPARQRERGFNQAREIGARVARALELPMLSALARVGTAPAQAMLAARQRRQNVRGAFVTCADVRGARLALVDDVMTTGATLAEAATVLREAGAEHVECWVVARTPQPAQG